MYDDSLKRICFIETTSGGAVLAIALVRRLCLFLYVNNVLGGNQLIPLTRSSSSYLYLNLNDWRMAAFWRWTLWKLEFLKFFVGATFWFQLCFFRISILNQVLVPIFRCSMLYFITVFLSALWLKTYTLQFVNFFSIYPYLNIRSNFSSRFLRNSFKIGMMRMKLSCGNICL